MKRTYKYFLLLIVVFMTPASIMFAQENELQQLGFDDPIVTQGDESSIVSYAESSVIIPGDTHEKLWVHPELMTIPGDPIIIEMRARTTDRSGGDRHNEWILSNPILYPGDKGSLDEVAVKDPSIVFYEGKWHLFYTARSAKQYTIGYVSADKLTELQYSQRHELKMIRGKTRYSAAPQIFFFQPQDKWYLIFQNRNSNYQPAYSTSKTISGPKSWSDPEPLIKKDTSAKWIDFWTICDTKKAYLFYTQNHHEVIVRSTKLQDFPDKWSEGKKVLDGVHEAVHIYKVQDQNKYHMIYELNHEGIRSFGLATAENLSGPWEKMTDKYATGDQLRYSEKDKKWTDMVSHGEAIRSGYDQRLEYEPEDCRWIIQGLVKEDLKGPYPSMPWKLGVIEKSEKQK
ncbi:MAG: non-reducing end alpha-L-arabinofuranosidase family hydrolase [Bacteroidota bacterium]